MNAGVKLWNACKHIHAFHWHCGPQMHQSQYVDHEYKGHNVRDIVPCWDCPGMLNGTWDRNENLCVRGSIKKLSVGWYYQVTHPACTKMCVSGGSSGDLEMPFSMCQVSSDVNCIITECDVKPHIIY